MTLRTHLATLEASSLIRLAAVQPELEYLFRHALVQDAAYASILKADRKRLHLAVGEALERLYPDQREELAGVLAHHFAAAGERDKAIEYARRAARRAEAAYAYHEAVRHLHNALDLLLPDEQIETRLALLEELADDMRLLGERAQAITLYQEALDVWRSLPHPAKWIALRLHRKIAETYLRLRSRAEIERFEAVSESSLASGLKLVEGEPPHPETVRLLATLANDAWSARAHQDWDVAERYARTAVEMAEKLDAPIEMSAALGALAVVFGARGRFRERAQLALRCLNLRIGAFWNDYAWLF